MTVSKQRSSENGQQVSLKRFQTTFQVGWVDNLTTQKIQQLLLGINPTYVYYSLINGIFCRLYIDRFATSLPYHLRTS